MDAQIAAAELRKFRAEADTSDVRSDGPAHMAWKAKVAAVMRSSLGDGSSTLKDFEKMHYYVGIWTGAPGEDQRDARYFTARVADAAALIDAAIYQLELQSDPDKGESLDTPSRTPNGPIFVVHGRDDARKYELMRLLDRAVEPEAIVLHEQANRGATILEKFERHAQEASYAVVLLTGDDEGRLRDKDTVLNLRGRQNVVLELGVFIGLLGRSNVAVLKDPDVEMPSDINGLVYISLDESGTWRHSLLKELDAARIKVDYGRIP